MGGWMNKKTTKEIYQITMDFFNLWYKQTWAMYPSRLMIKKKRHYPALGYNGNKYYSAEIPIQLVITAVFLFWVQG